MPTSTRSGGGTALTSLASLVREGARRRVSIVTVADTARAAPLGRILAAQDARVSGASSGDDRTSARPRENWRQILAPSSRRKDWSEGVRHEDWSKRA